MLRCGATASTDKIQIAALCKISKFCTHIVGGFVVFTEFIGESGVEVSAEIAVTGSTKFFSERPNFFKSATTINANDEWFSVRD